MYELLKADVKIRVSENLVDNFKEINARIAEAYGLALRKPVAGKQNVLMTDASFRASGYAPMILENDEWKLLSKRKNFRTEPRGRNLFRHEERKIMKDGILMRIIILMQNIMVKTEQSRAIK